MSNRALLTGLAAIGLTLLASSASAQDVTLKLHQLLPLKATIPAKFLQPWIEKVQEESGGRIKIDHFPSMQLGGKPPSLINQVTDGAVDLTWTVLGYTPGRFPMSEAFELPFMVTTGEQTSRAFHAYYEKHLQDEFSSIKVIAVHTHGPGLLHVKKRPINKLEDLRGLKLRGPTRVITKMLGTLGAVPVGMPVPAVPESISKGVIDGTAIPWEITLPLKIADLVQNHTEFSGANGLYTATFVFAMNKASYDRLPDDLRKVIDNNSGIEAAAWAGRAMDGGDEVGRKKAQGKGNNIVVLDAAETQRWRDAAAPVVDEWIAEMTDKGHDGAMLVEEARKLIAEHSK